MIRKCCVCRRIEVKGGWTRNSLSEDDCRPVSHVYCPNCFAGMMQQIDRFFLRKTYKAVYAHVEAGHR